MCKYCELSVKEIENMSDRDKTEYCLAQERCGYEGDEMFYVFGNGAEAYSDSSDVFKNELWRYCPVCGRDLRSSKKTEEIKDPEGDKKPIAFAVSDEFDTKAVKASTIDELIASLTKRGYSMDSIDGLEVSPIYEITYKTGDKKTLRFRPTLE